MGLIEKIKFFWIEILLFVSYGLILIIASPMDITFINAGDKWMQLLYESNSFDIMGRSPLYSVFGWLVTRLPFQDSTILILFLSVIPAIIAAVLVYICIWRKTLDRFCSIAGSLFLMSSALYFMQAQRVEVFTLASLFVILSYYCITKDHFLISSILIGLGILVSWYVAFIACWFCVLFKDVRRFSWIVVSPAVLYICFLVFLRNDYGSVIDNSEFIFGFSSNWQWFFKQFISSFISLGALCGLGLITIWFCRDRKLFAISMTLFIGVIFHVLAKPDDVNPLSVYLPMFSVASGIGFQTFDYKKIIIGLSVIIIVANSWFYSIRLMDSSPTSARYLMEQLDVMHGSLSSNVKLGNNTVTSCFFLPWGVKYANYRGNRDVSFQWDKSGEFCTDYYVEFINDYQQCILKKNF